MQIGRETIECTVASEPIEKHSSQLEPKRTIRYDLLKLPDSDRTEGQKKPTATATKPLRQHPGGDENDLKSPKKISSQPQKPRKNSAKLVAKSSVETIETDDNLLIRLTSFQQSIDAKLDEIM